MVFHYHMSQAGLKEAVEVERAKILSRFDGSRLDFYWSTAHFGVASVTSKRVNALK